MPDELSQRTTQEVIDDHLRLATENDVEADLERNVADDIVVLSGRGIFHGHAGVHELARQLLDEVPSGEWVYGARRFAGHGVRAFRPGRLDRQEQQKENR